MTPERAREIALTCFVEGKHLGFVSDAVIADRILKACAEEREACAKIADAQKYGAGLNMVTGILSCGCAKAIRGGA